MLTFTIYGELPATNEIVEASKNHWSQYSRMKKKFTKMVTRACKDMPPVDYADFTINWVCKNRRKDKDNITGGQKFIFDGLVEAGILTNDGWSQVGNIRHTFEIDKDNPRIEVTLGVHQ